MTLNYAGFLPIFLDVLSRPLLSSVTLLSVGIYQAFNFFSLVPFFTLHTSLRNFTYSSGFNYSMDSNDSHYQIFRLDYPPRLKPTYLTSLYSLTYEPQIQHVPN